MIDGRTEIIAHLGWPTHSFKAPMIYNPYFEAEGINAVLVPMGCQVPAYPALLKSVFALTNHQYNPQSVVISKRFWDTLSDADRKVLQDAANESSRYQREQSRAAQASILEELKKNGMQVTELPAAEVAKLREKMKPVIAKHAASVGEATVNAMMADLAKLRK